MNVICGAFGKTGRVVVERLRAEGKPMRLLSHDPERAGLPDVVIADLADTLAIERALCDAQAVFAILPDPFAAARFHAQRRGMVDALVRAVERCAVPRVVLVSSSLAALGEGPGNGFGAELAYFERRLSETSSALTSLRAGYFQDNVRQALPWARRDGVYPCLFDSPERSIMTVAARDVGAVAAQKLLEPVRAQREVVDLVGPSYSSLEIASCVERAIGRSLRLVQLTTEQQLAMFASQMSAEAARAMVETLRCLSAGISASGDRSERLLTSLDCTLEGA